MARIKGAKSQERYRDVPVAEPRTPRTRSFSVWLFIVFLCDLCVLRVFAL